MLTILFIAFILTLVVAIVGILRLLGNLNAAIRFGFISLGLAFALLGTMVLVAAL